MSEYLPTDVEELAIHGLLRELRRGELGDDEPFVTRVMAVIESPVIADRALRGEHVIHPNVWLRWLAAAACLTIVAGAWWFTQRQDAGLGLRVAEVRGSVQCSVFSVQYPEARRAVVGDMLRPGDGIDVGADGFVKLAYVDTTHVELRQNTRLRVTLGAGKDKGAKRLALDGGRLVCWAAPQKMPLEIQTPHAVARMVGTRFTLEADAAATRIKVVAGLVRLTRSEDQASVNVPAGHEATVSSGADLLVEPTRPQGLLLDLDFEDRILPEGSVGTVVEDPRMTNGRFCVAGVRSKDERLFRVKIFNGDRGLFTYREGAVLSFDYWVKKQTGAIDVYFWNATRLVSPGANVWAPTQEQWTHVAMRLADFNKESRDGDLITELVIQTTPGGNELLVDNIRIETEAAP